MWLEGGLMNDQSKGSRLDRFMRLFTDVRAGEGAQALLLAFNVFLILMAYYLMKPSRDALMLEQANPQIKAYASAGMAVLLIPLVQVYGRFADRVPRMRLISWVTYGFAAILVVFYLLAQGGVRVAIPFFLYVGIFNLMIVAQFWSFANDVYTTGEGERLFPILVFGMSFGAVLGAAIATALVGPLGHYPLMLLAAGLILVGLVITNYIDKLQRTRTESHLPPSQTTAEMPAATGQFRLETGEFKAITVEQAQASGSGQGAFALVFKTRYLLLIALMVMLTNWVNTLGGYMLDVAVDSAAESAVAAGQAGGLDEGQYIARVLGGFYAGVNLVTLLAQLFVVSRIIKYIGVRGGLLVLPIIALLGNGAVFLVPIFVVIRAHKTVENATDYSLQNTVKNALWLPTTREQKYKAKQVIDAFFARIGDGMQAVVVFVGSTYLALSLSGFAVINVVLAVLWLAVVVAIGREYVHLTKTGQPPV
jgi:AAA family ATP:ADP antiporter